MIRRKDEPVSKPRRSRRREEADGWETKGIRLLTSAATSFRKGFEIASDEDSFFATHLSPHFSIVASYLWRWLQVTILLHVNAFTEPVRPGQAGAGVLSNTQSRDVAFPRLCENHFCC
jgi:hypothetical protein